MLEDYSAESKVVPNSGTWRGETEGASVRDNLNDSANFKQDKQEKQNKTRKDRGPGRPRSPCSEVVSLDECEQKVEEFEKSGDVKEFIPEVDNGADVQKNVTVRKRGRPRVRPVALPGADEKEKVAVRKRGRPRVRPEAPPGEKKKLGRPKDETKTNVTCEICGKFYKQRADCIRHERSHYGIKEFECDFCHKRFVQKGALTIHLRLHTGERPYKCSYCPESFPVQASLDRHVFKHTKQGTKCPQCQSIFATPASVKQHIKDVHTTEKPHMCQICGQRYKIRRTLRIHMENHDKRICTVCGKVFNTMFALMAHRHIHELNQKCNYCDRSFKSEEELQAHSKLRGRTYQCEMCCYSFNKAEFLNNHNRRDHWKQMGLEQLPRNNLPWSKKPKPEGFKRKKSHKKLPIVQGSDSSVLGTLDSGSELRNSQCSILPVPSPLKTIQQQNHSVPTEPTVKPIWNAIILSKPETKASAECEVKSGKLEGHAQSDSDQDFSTHLDDVNDYNSDQGEIKIVEQKIIEKDNREPNVEVMFETEFQAEDSATPPLKPGVFVKVEISETDKSMENEQENASTPKEDPIECQLEELEKKKEDPFDSEDDEVPLAALLSRLCQTARLAKSGPAKKKKQTIEECSGDEVGLSGSSRSACEGNDTETDEPKPKRRRRRKHAGEGPRKKVYQKRNMTCSFCGDNFKGRVALKEHKKSSHSDAKPYVKAKAGPVICELCGKSYATPSSLAVHRGQHEEYQRFKCDECPKAFIFQCLLEKHKRIEHRRERLICPLCGKQFKYGPDMKHHLLRHEEEKPFKCDKCPAAFSFFSALHGHKAIHRQAVFTCTVCNKNFRFANSLRVHKRLHYRENYIRCELCEREFSEKALLKKHMAIHSVDREVKCVVCDKIYYKKSELIIHQAKEHPNHPLIGKTARLYSCNLCSMEFTKESHLRSHSYIHGNEYRFKCDMCEDQKFKQKAGLRNHWKRFHLIEPPKRNFGKKLEAKKTTVRTVTNTTARPPANEFNNELEFIMQRMECESNVSI